jgi:hypothetical protein
MTYTANQLKRYIKENNGMVFINEKYVTEAELSKMPPGKKFKFVSNNSICSVRVSTK